MTKMVFFVFFFYSQIVSSNCQILYQNEMTSLKVSPNKISSLQAIYKKLTFDNLPNNKLLYFTGKQQLSGEKSIKQAKYDALNLLKKKRSDINIASKILSFIYKQEISKQEIIQTINKLSKNDTFCRYGITMLASEIIQLIGEDISARKSLARIKKERKIKRKIAATKDPAQY